MSAKSSLSVLDPGIGTGILSCATVEQFVQQQQQQDGGNISLDGFDIDPHVLEVAAASLTYAKKWAERSNVRVTFTFHNEDFVFAGLGKIAGSLAVQASSSSIYDAVIMNPPYFKVSASDPRVKAVAKFAGKQTNIYTLFLSVASQLLSSDGILVSITPRSFASGMYFQAFRRSFLQDMRPIALHLFDSRKDVFPHMDVLQEAIIMVARPRLCADDSQVIITTSNGSEDIDRPRRITVRLSQILLSGSKFRLAIPTTEAESQLLESVHAWPNTLSDLGLEVSTGPVVPFRATEFLVHDPSSEKGRVVPLLWMNNITGMSVRWPLRNHKPEYILDAPANQYMLVPNERYVLIRRFSTKEEQRRLVAAVVPESLMNTDHLGLENHLNFIHCNMRGLERNVAYGLAVLLNSSLMDRYFRILNGNTQVNAYDLRQMPLPPLEKIELLGEHYLGHAVDLKSSQDLIDGLVEQVLSDAL